MQKSPQIPLIFVVAGLSLLLACGGGGSTSNDLTGSNTPPTLEIEASRISGIAPLSVHFYADYSSDSGEDAGFLHNDYTCDFGDPSGGVWGTSGKSKNTAKGGVAAHVFESPGTYMVSITVREPDGHIVDGHVNISVSDPDEYYAGTNTVCVSDVAHNDFSGAPGGARHIATDDLSTVTQYATAGNRILFQRGSSWTTGGLEWPRNAGPVTIGAYGTGTNPDGQGIFDNAPKITVTSGHFLSLNGKQDWRVMDLNLVDPSRSYWGISGDYERQRVLLLRLKLVGFYSGIELSIWNTDKLMVSDQIAVISCESSDSRVYPLFIGSERLAILGNVFKDSRKAHVTRVWQAYRSVISHNIISGSSLDNTAGQHALKLHGPGPGAMLGTPVPETGYMEHRTEFLVVSDNVFGSSGPWPVAIGPEAAQWAEELRNIVFERNRISSEYGSQSSEKVDISLIVWASHVVVRNNILDGTGSEADYLGILIDRRGIEPPPVGVEVYNNTIYNSDNQSGGTQMIGLRVGESATGTIIRNNLVSFPDFTGTISAILNNSSDLVASNNLLSGNPGFVDPDNAAPLSRDFRCQGGSPGIDKGVMVPVFEDFAGDARPKGAYDIGAFENP